MLFFFLGILAANWVGQEKLLQYGMLNQYYVGQLAYAQLESGAYFLFLCKRRMRIFGMTMLFVYTRFGIFVLPGVIGWHAFSLGYLFVNALVCMKFQGMLLVLLSMFPQIIFYAAAYFGLGRAVHAGRNSPILEKSAFVSAGVGPALHDLRNLAGRLRQSGFIKKIYQQDHVKDSQKNTCADRAKAFIRSNKRGRDQVWKFRTKYPNIWKRLRRKEPQKIP